MIRITGSQRTDPEYLKNAESEHLISWSLPNLTNEIGLFCNSGFWFGASIPRCLNHSNIHDLSSKGPLSIWKPNLKNLNKFEKLFYSDQRERWYFFLLLIFTNKEIEMESKCRIYLDIYIKLRLDSLIDTKTIFSVFPFLYFIYFSLLKMK